MKGKLFTLSVLSILSLVFLISFMSAAVDFLETDGTEITTLSLEGNHNTQITATFLIENDFASTLDNVDLTGTLPTLTFGSETISSDKLSVSPGTISSIPANSNSSTITFTIEIPENKLAGTYTGTWSITSDRTTSPHNLDISLTINETKALSVESKTIESDENSTTFKVKNEGNTILSNIALTLSEADEDILTLSQSTISSLNPGESSSEITATLKENARDNLGFGKELVIITANASGTTSTGNIEIEKSFCEDCANPGNLQMSEIGDSDIGVKTTFGKNEEYWFPFDEVEIELEVEIKGSYDVDDITIEWALYTESGDEILDGEESDFNLDYDDDEKKITISFKLDKNIDDLEGQDKLIFYAKAKGEIDDNNAGDLDGEDTCHSVSREIELAEDEFVMLDDIQILPEIAQCGSTIQVTADIWNIDSNELENVEVRVYNDDLGINEFITFDELKSFNDEQLDINIDLPTNIEENFYELRFEIRDEDGVIFETDSDDYGEDDAIFYKQFEVKGGNCEVSGEGIDVVSADLEEGGEAGEELIMKVTIVNTEADGSFEIQATDYSDWATLESIEPAEFDLDKGNSKQVLITLNVKDDALGTQEFTIEILSDGETINTFEVEDIEITEDSGRNWRGITGNVISGDNWYLWGIGALNVILVIIIILVAIKVAKN